MITYPEWNIQNGGYTEEATIEERIFSHENKSELNRFEKEYGNISNRLVRDITDMKVSPKSMERKTKKRGRVMQRYVQDELVRAHQGANLTQKIYDRKISLYLQEKRDTPIDIGIILDQSGSTRFGVGGGYRRIDLIKYAALTIGRVLSSWGDDFFLWSFHSHKDENPTFVEKLKQSGDVWTESVEARVAAIEETSSTNEYNNKDGVITRHANKTLLGMARDSKLRKKLLYIVSDGVPNCDYCRYQEEYALEDSRRSLQEGQENGINYIYLSISEDRRTPKYISQIQPHCLFARNFVKMSDLVTGLAEVYERLRQGRL
jgi:nitric oxide reductase activation protein